MGFWAWLTGKKERVTTLDRIWLTIPAKRDGCRKDIEDCSLVQPALVLAHFPSTLTAVQQDLTSAGLGYRVITGPVTAKDANRFLDEGGPSSIHLGLVKQLRLEEMGFDELEEEDGSFRMIVAERHLLRKYDDIVTAFAGSLKRRCRVSFCLSLDDPLMKMFTGETTKGAPAAGLGMEDSQCVESNMVSRRIRAAQEKLAATAGPERDALSAEQWLAAYQGIDTQ